MVKINLLNEMKFRFGFLTKTQTTILSAAGILAVTSGITTLLGLIKSRLLTTFFGISADLSVFYTADRIPSLIYSLFVVGVLSTVFIPIYADVLKKDENESHEVASVIINLGILFFGLFGGLAFIFTPQLINLISVGQFTPEEIQLGTNLMRIMLGAQLLLLLGSFLTSLAQTHNYFLLPSLAPIIYNLSMILGIVFLSDSYGIYGPSYGIIIGAGTYLLIQIPIIKKFNFKYKITLKIQNHYIKKILAIVPPRFLSVLINTTMGTIYNSMAILISKPSVIYLKFADQLQAFPVNLFGASIAAAALPTLSKNTNPNDPEKFKKVFITSLHQMLFFVLPCSVILLVLRVPVIRIIYGASKFPWEGTVKTAYTLAFFSLSIFSQSATLLITRAFYALKNTVTPLRTTAIFAPLNLLLCLLFIKGLNWGAWSIALAYSSTSVIETLVLLTLLGKALGGFNIKELLYPFVKMSYATVLMGICLYTPLKFLDKYVFDTTRTIQLLLITGVAGVFGLTAYLFFTKIFKVEEIQLMHKLIRKVGLGKILLETPKIETVAEIEN